MKTISEFFNGVKISLTYNSPSYSDFITKLKIVIENEEGKQMQHDFSIMNVHFGTNTFNINKDRLFYEVLEHICISSDLLSFEQHCEEMKVLNEEKNSTETILEYEQNKDLAERINSVVKKDWVDSIRCYLYLQNYSELWS